MYNRSNLQLGKNNVYEYIKIVNFLKLFRSFRVESEGFYILILSLSLAL